MESRVREETKIHSRNVFAQIKENVIAKKGKQEKSKDIRKDNIARNDFLNSIGGKVEKWYVKIKVDVASESITFSSHPLSKWDGGSFILT